MANQAARRTPATTAAAARKRLHRERLASGLIVLRPLSIAPELLYRLVETNLLDWKDSEDIVAVTTAVEALLEQQAQGTSRSGARIGGTM